MKASTATRNTFLEAAKLVLEEAQRPMTAQEIVAQARLLGLLSTSGATPWKTMNARLSSEILAHKLKSDFKRVDSGLYALREWSTPEYVANRRIIALHDENILVFDRDMLRSFIPKNGLSPAQVDHNGLVNACYPMKRADAEVNFSVVQLVSVYVVRYRSQIATYKRTKRLPEKRLQSVYSCFFGGHLNPDDILPLFRLDGKEHAKYFAERELHEEVRLASPPSSIRFRGLLYDPRSQVSTQHLGVVFVVSLEAKALQIGERGFLTDLRFETKSDIRRRIKQFENWSELLIRERL